jgi:site-specific DNA recombinase
MKAVVRKLRCAVYTRNSSEEGLELEFNSLDAQREACEAYVAKVRNAARDCAPHAPSAAPFR